MITDFLPIHMIEALMWTLVHSVWQLALIALVAGILLKFFSKQSALLRYGLAFSAMVFSIFMVIYTFAVQYLTSQSGVTSVVDLAMDVSTVTFVAQPVTSALTFLDLYQSLIVNVWLLGSLLFLIRFTLGWLHLRKLVEAAVVDPISESVSFMALKQGYNINRTILIKVSESITSPMVIGFLKPIILFPVGMINQLTLAEVEAVMAHELAHIRRHDFLLNLFQSLMETVFYFHPGVWYLSKVINKERENCCDDMAILHTGNAVTFARTLVKLQDLEFTQLRPALAMAGANGDFSQRVKRILDVPVRSSGFRDKLFTLLLMVFALVGFNEENENVISEPQELDIYVIDDCPQSSEEIKFYLDTIPSRNNFHIKKTDKNKSVELQMEDGLVKKLIVDGKLVSPAELEQVEIKMLIDSLKPNFNKEMITVFPDCNSDLGHFYLLNKNQETLNLDAFINRENLSSEAISSINFNPSEMNFEQLRRLDIDSLLVELQSTKADKTNILVDSLSDLWPRELFEQKQLFQFRDHFRNPRKVTKIEDGSSVVLDVRKDQKTLADKISWHLEMDKLIDIRKENTATLSGTGLTINDGQKESLQLWMKYRDLYEKHTGLIITPEMVIEIVVPTSAVDL